jgi:hypothetical protein
MKVCECCHNGEDCFLDPLEEYFLCQSCADANQIDHRPANDNTDLLYVRQRCNTCKQYYDDETAMLRHIAFYHHSRYIVLYEEKLDERVER